LAHGRQLRLLAFTLLGTFAIASLSWHAIEKPMLREHADVPAAPVAAVAAAGVN
jgi:peptidoglycan/LPS O-acetylase OafA/YrhL